MFNVLGSFLFCFRFDEFAIGEIYRVEEKYVFSLRAVQLFNEVLSSERVRNDNDSRVEIGINRRIFDIRTFSEKITRI